MWSGASRLCIGVYMYAQESAGSLDLNLSLVAVTTRVLLRTGHWQVETGHDASPTRTEYLLLVPSYLIVRREEFESKHCFLFAEDVVMDHVSNFTRQSKQGCVVVMDLVFLN